jgi:hypothetical protein
MQRAGMKQPQGNPMTALANVGGAVAGMPPAQPPAPPMGQPPAMPPAAPPALGPGTGSSSTPPGLDVFKSNQEAPEDAQPSADAGLPQMPPKTSPLPIMPTATGAPAAQPPAPPMQNRMPLNFGKMQKFGM